jgi:hypothetical protein
MENRFLLFEGPEYYPNGGVDDYSGAFADIQSAMDHTENSNFYDKNWAQIAIWLGGELVPILYRAPAGIHEHCWIRQWSWWDTDR